MTRLERASSVASRWINRNLWTGHDRPICAEMYGRYLRADDRRAQRLRRRIDIIDRLLNEPDHCRKSWCRWPVKPKRP